MIISNHHILYDGWSNGIILGEFFNAYNDLAEGKPLKPLVKTKFKDKLTDFARSRNITFASLLYSVWGILLQHYNSTYDVLFDTTVSGRSAKVRDIENMVGLFINTLPLRMHTNPGEKCIFRGSPFSQVTFSYITR